MLCRKRFIDDKLLAAVETGVDAVVILGAGFDTRAYRLSALHGVPVYEVDLAANIARKDAALRKAFGRVPECHAGCSSSSRRRSEPPLRRRAPDDDEQRGSSR